MVSEAKTIMVVEDEVTLLQVIAKKLKVSVYSTITCISAKQAIDYLKNLDENPTAIWLDYYLPEMSGMDFMVEISNNAKWRSIPVIVVSNSAGEEKKKAMFALGAKKYLLKAQYRLDDIVKIIDEVITENQKSV